jgi:predicted Fe-Mo cluster-binding NifX family protein
MKLLFPTDENMGYLSQRGAHFGKAKFYTLIILEDGKIVDVEGIVNEGHSSGACSNAVANIMTHKPDVLIVSGIGASPAQQFIDVGLDVYFDTLSTTVKDSVELFLADELEKSVGNGTCSVN